ncbi:MAG: nucleotidyltransferase substrate binding protein [Magnetococcales bacterium]|nr:nucleotidyltransferase substrate binding protein [Magnetococcales bacterium]
MSEAKVKQSLANLDKALKSLGELVQKQNGEDYIVDATIQRFEYTYELLWKTLKRCLQYEGISSQTPKETLKKAFAIHWLKDEAVWLDMHSDRNLTTHVYNEKDVEKIYLRIKNIYYSEILATYELLLNRYKDLI